MRHPRHLPTCTLQCHVSTAAVEGAQPATTLPPHPPLILYERSRAAGERPQPCYVAHRLVTSAPFANAMASTSGAASHRSSINVSSDTESDRSDDQHGGIDAAYLSARQAASNASTSNERVLFVLQHGEAYAGGGRGTTTSNTSAAVEELRRVALAASAVDFVLVMYSVLTNRWQEEFSGAVIGGMIVSNVLFMWAVRVYRLWMITGVCVLLPLNFAVIFSVNTSDILLARLLVVFVECGTLIRLRSLLEPAIFFI